MRFMVYLLFIKSSNVLGLYATLQLTYASLCLFLGVYNIYEQIRERQQKMVCCRTH